VRSYGGYGSGYTDPGRVYSGHLTKWIKSRVNSAVNTGLNNT